MLTPFLAVGLGGAGGKTVRAIREQLTKRLDNAGWLGDFPAAWQLIHIDTPLSPDGPDFPAPQLPVTDYVGLVPGGVDYETFFKQVLGGLEGPEKTIAERIFFPPSRMPMTPMNDPKLRAVYRLVSLGGLRGLQGKLEKSIAEMLSPAAAAELSEVSGLLSGSSSIGPPTDPVVVVISSLAGSSGSGMLIDVTAAIHSVLGEFPRIPITSFLYTPDVFDALGKSAFLACNSRAALGEILSGFWREMPSSISRTLYERQGISVGGAKGQPVSPEINYLVGRGNGVIDLRDMGDFYHAVAGMVTAWMTDASIQDDFLAYRHLPPGRVAGFPDSTNLSSPLSAFPFGMLGHVKVSLGVEKFLDYASERIAKQALWTLLHQHTVSDPELTTRSEEEWIEYSANLHENAFIAESGFEELSDQNNQVIEALHPDTSELRARHSAAVSDAALKDVPKDGRSFDEWVAAIVDASEATVPRLLEDFAALHQEKCRDWVQSTPQIILDLVGRTMCREGMPVTSRLLEHLINHCRAGARELLQERDSHLQDRGALSSRVSQSMEQVSSLEAIPANHPAVARGIYEAELAFNWASMAELKSSVSELVLDFTENFLEPLRRVLSASMNVLHSGANDPKLPDGRTNPYSSLPTGGDGAVPRRFRPLPTELMVIEVDEFPVEFDALVLQTVNDPSVSASRIVIDEILAGARSPEVAKLEEKQQWDTLTLRQVWIPKNRHHQISHAEGQRANFDFPTDFLQYLQIAKMWLRVPGRPFSAFANQTLLSYLAADGDHTKEELRSHKFLRAFKDAMAALEPWLRVDPALELAIHGQVIRDVACTGIPFAQSHPLRASVDNLLLARGLNPATNRFYSADAKAEMTQNIDFFVTTPSVLNPIVASSLMEPIVREWRARSGDSHSRDSFMAWRRVAPLAESIPAHPDQWQTMLKGWFVARMLGYLWVENDGEAARELGPKINIWSGATNGWTHFPFPLCSIDPLKSIVNAPAVILDSLVIAMAECSGTGNTQPLEPYKQLLALGGGDGHVSFLTDWVVEGKTPLGAPLPPGEHGGTPEMSYEERRMICGDYLSSLLENFRSKMRALDGASSDSYPLVWEIRHEVESALESCRRAVAEIEPEERL